MLVEGFAEKGCDALFQRTGHKLVQSHIVVYQEKFEMGIHQSEPLELVHYVRELYGVLFQEFAACGEVEEEVLYHQAGARGAGLRLLALEP